MPKLYDVKVTTHYVVKAKNKVEAVDEMARDIGNNDISTLKPKRIRELATLPNGWYDTDTPYNDDSLAIKELLES